MLYQNELEKNNVEVVSVNIEEQKNINNVIKNIMGGNKKKSDVDILMNIIKRFIEKKAQGVILGCTEIAYAFSNIKIDSNFKVFDTIDIIAKSAVDFARK